MKAIATMGLLLLAAQSVAAQSAEALQKQLNAEAAVVKAWCSDPVLVQAVHAQNARKMKLADIQKADTLWMEGKDEALVKQMTTGACADRIRELAAKAGFGESFVMDDQGALVCATERTSDYWQGDEDKWIRAWDKGRGATFIDRPRYDESAHGYLAQISVPIMEDGHAIGVIMGGATLKHAPGP